MSINIVQAFVEELRATSLFGEATSTCIGIVGTMFIVWLAWRLWRFSVVLYFWPNDPKLLPYSIPWIGHTFQFLRDPEGTIQRGNAYFNGDAPFALMIGGLKLVIIRNAQDVRSVWKNTKALSFDTFIQTAFNGIGIPRQSTRPMFEANPAQFYHGTAENKPHFVVDNPANKRYIDLQEGWIREQLSPGERMNTVTGIFLKWTLVEAGTKAFLGEEIFNLDPEFVQHYIDWEKTSWKVAHQHPGFLSRDMHKAREGLVKILTKYFAMPSDQRPNLSWLFNRMQSEQQKLGLKSHEVAAISLIMLWGVHLNTFRLLFWVLAHTLNDPSLIEAIRNETSQARLQDGTFSVSYLVENCPILNSVWLESLRLYNAAAVIRAAETMTIVGGKTIYPGDRVLGPFRLMHLSDQIFGSDASTFDHERWVRNENLANVKGLYPFGGGHTYCPGRVIAKQEVFTFVATALDRFEIFPAGICEKGKGKWKVPGIGRDPALTMMDPSEDLIISISARRTLI